MSAALLKLNFFTGIYFAMAAYYLSFYFQNLRRSFFKGLFSAVASAFMKLIYQAKFNLYQNGAVSFIYILKQKLFFLRSMETKHQMKAEKIEKPGQRRVELAKACLNHLKPFKNFHTFFFSRLANFLYSTRSFRKIEMRFFSDLWLILHVH